MHQDLQKLVGLMKLLHGIDIDCFDDSFLSKSLAKRLGSTGQSIPDYLTRIASDPAEAMAFRDSLQISYSTFFRHPLTFALLEQLVLPELIRQSTADHRELRIWSAACAAGQEPYSIAILLDDISTANGHPIRCRLIATDNSEIDLTRARQGCYDPSAVQNVRYKHMQTCFSQVPAGFSVVDRLKNMVDFSKHDLLDAQSSPETSIFGEFDLILCSNVLFYYRNEMRGLILGKLEKNLAPAGYLVTGEAEREIIKSLGGFNQLMSGGNIFQKSRSSRQQ